VRLTLISLTDTFGRVAIETFSEMAERYRVWLHAGVNMAQDWKVVCNDIDAFNGASSPRLPGGVRCEEENPQRVMQLGDPFDPGRDYVYEATTDRVSNMALLFNPDGRLVSKQVKTYLTPVELPGQLDLVPGRVSGGLSAVRTPVGTLGFMTSKDAWMPDVQAKLDAQHVDLLVQPEFFVNDLVKREGMWAPDTLKASGYANALRMPSVRAMVLPELTGNIFDFSADAQSHFALKSGRGRTPRGHLVGQPDAPGLVSTPWVVRDPVRRREPFPTRRRRLAAAGAALAPGSDVGCPSETRPGPCENGHVEGVFRRDVELAAPKYRRFRGKRRRTSFSRARALARSRNPQRNAAISMHGRFGAAAFEERRGARDQIFVVVTRNGGRTWSRPVHATGRRAGSVDERWPAVAVGARRRVTVAWTEMTSDSERVFYARSAGGRRFAAPRAIDAGAPKAGQLKPALAPGQGDAVHAAWVDERFESADDSMPQAHLFYTRIARGRVGASTRLDSEGPAALAAKLDHAWFPRVSARGRRVLVSWLDFRNYDWGVFSRVSNDGGTTFAAEQRVTNNDIEGDDAQEELADAPEALMGRGGPLIAWTDWRKRASAATRPHQQYDIFVASPGGPNRQVDPYGGRQVSTFAPSLCATGGRDALVAFQDSSRGRSDVRVVRVSGGRRRGRARLVNDAGARGGNAWRPRLGCWGNRVVALWEDERNGPGQIHYATAPARRLR
jgi:hypothetical protein